MFGNLTDEQLSIQRNCAAFSMLPSMRMRIIARAGTGKTTSLEAVVMKIKLDARTEPSICYTAFNKTTETEFGERIHKKLMSNNLSNKDIESRTLHSLCYNWFIGTRNNEYIRDMKENIDTDAVVKYFQIDQYAAQRYGESNISVDPGQGRNKSRQQRIRFEATWVAELILKTLDNFLNSASVEVTDKHLPYQVTYRFHEWTPKMDVYLQKHRILKISAAEHYARYDFRNRAMALYQQSLAHNEASGIPVTHSVYQKYAQLSNAILTSKKGVAYNVYLVDEAQDLNECQCALIARQWQNGATIALVGDPAQSIYQFRGACRQFERWEVENEETLTQSFRFGRQVARLCNIFLGLEKLWLLSLKTTMEAKGIAVKKECSQLESASKDRPLLTPASEGAPTQTQTQLTQAGGAAAVTLIKALVRGLVNVQDKWVSPQTVLAYPYTVICRTNNSTYYALLAGIQEAERQEKEGAAAAGKAVQEEVFQFPTVGQAAAGGGRGDDARAAAGGADRAPAQAPPLIVNRNASSDQRVTASVGSKRDFYDSFGVASTKAGTSGNKAPMVFDLTQGEDDGEFYGGARKTAASAAPMYLHHSLSKPRRVEPAASQEPGRTAPERPAAPGGVQITTTPVTAESGPPRQRKFYINGVKSYGQLENGLVRRIEQLASISIQKPYSYKGEQYINMDDLKAASLEMEDVALLELVEITEKWGADIGKIKQMICDHYASTPAEADVLVTTVHKSKGLEWDNVGLGDDIGSPLGAQPLFVIQCNPDPDRPAAAAGGEPVQQRFMVGLEQTSKAAYERINFCLCVRKPPKQADGAPAPGAINAQGAYPGGVRTQQARAFADDRNAEDVFRGTEDEEHVTPAALLPAVPVPGGNFAPSVHNALVPLLPSTVALGMQLQRSLTVLHGGDFATPGMKGGAPASPRGSKCPLICCIAKHLNCAERVRKMYSHELAERRKLYGAGNVCGMEKTGDAPGNYQLVFTDEAGGTPAHLTQQTAVRGAEAVLGTTGTSAAKVKPEPGLKLDQGEPVPRVDPFLVKFSNRQNANEWYVAVSRAKRVLRVNDELEVILEWIARDIGGLRTQLKVVIGEEAEVIPPEDDTSKQK